MSNFRVGASNQRGVLTSSGLPSYTSDSMPDPALLEPGVLVSVDGAISLCDGLSL